MRYDSEIRPRSDLREISNLDSETVDGKTKTGFAYLTPKPSCKGKGEGLRVTDAGKDSRFRFPIHSSNFIERKKSQDS